MAWSVPWMFTTICQIAPPRKVWGDWVTNCQISVSLSFQTARAFSRFCTTQLSDMENTSFSGQALFVGLAPLLSYQSAAGNEGQDLFCKGDDNAPR